MRCCFAYACRGQAAERAVVTRLQRTAPGVTIARQRRGWRASDRSLRCFHLSRRSIHPVSERIFRSSPLSVSSILGAVVWMTSIAWSKSRIAGNLYAEGSKLPTPYTIELTPQALLIESAWFACLSRLEPHRRRSFYASSKPLFSLAPTHALPVPARCFPSAEEYNAFVAEFRSYTHDMRPNLLLESRRSTSAAQLSR